MKPTPSQSTATSETAAPEAIPEAMQEPVRELVQDWVTVARLVRPQGRKGELLADLLTDFPERFAQRRHLFLRAGAGLTPTPVALEEHWLHKDRVVFKFAGVDSIEAAEPLRDHDVVIPRAERAPLDEDSVYIGDLSGCVLYDRATVSSPDQGLVGEIVDVDRESSSTPLIVVRRRGAREDLLIPFAKAYLPRIDLEARRMEMTLPEGLLALNDPLTPEERPDAATGEGSRPAHNAQPGRRQKRR